MRKNWTLPKVGAAVAATWLGVVLAGGAHAEKDLTQSPEWPAPYIYTVPYCVVAIHKDPNFINLMDPNREISEAALAFAYKEPPPVKVGDLVTITPATKTKSGQPEFAVFKAQDPSCKKFIGE
ncbi:MAG TPA: hypothetical protein VIS07_13650 [Candidatus Binatia bacterium]